MGFFRTQLNHFTGLTAMQDQIVTLREELQHARSLLTGTQADSQPTRTGNPYDSYSAQVDAIAEKYECTATWGNQLRNIINLRAFFIIGGGVQPTLKADKEDKQAELDFIKRLVEHNNLDEEVPQLWCREAEIVGKACIVLMEDEIFKGKKAASGATLKARYLPWETTKYRITAYDNDYTRYQKCKYNTVTEETETEFYDGSKETDGEEFKEEQFVYMRFGGRIHKVNDTPPPVAQLLKQIEDMDKALWDWRHINHLYAAPTPHINFDGDNAELAVKSFLAKLISRSWWLGKLLCTANAHFELVSPSEDGLESLRQELVHLAKVISGASGVPVHFMGLPDLLSNRATADNLVELIVASTNSERKTWIGGYEELFKKALAMSNELLGTNFDTEAVGVRLSELGAVQIQKIIDLMLPMEMQGIISKKTVREAMPEVDPVAEEKRVKEQMEEDMENALKSIDFNSVTNPMGKQGRGNEATAKSQSAA